MIFDLICAGIALFFLVLGIFRGLIRQLFGVAGFLGGLVLARLFAEPAAEELGPSLGLQPVLATIAFAVAIFIAVEVVAHLIGSFLHGHLGAITGTLDKLGGGALGLAKGLLIVWAIGSLAALFVSTMPAAYKNVGLARKLDFAHSQVIQLAQNESFLGDIQAEIGAARAKK